MLDAQKFCSLLIEKGLHTIAGVPCSYLNSFINAATVSGRYVACANEGDAVAVAAGTWLGGPFSAVLMQNSGLTNATSPLTSLVYTFQIPVLGFVSWRGEPGQPDEPQHVLLGQLTPKWLTDMEVPWEFLSDDETTAAAQVDKAFEYMQSRQPFFFVVKKNTFAPFKPPFEAFPAFESESVKPVKIAKAMVPRADMLTAIVNENKTYPARLIATTGKTGRELFEVADLPEHIYMVGSMGCTSSFGLGLARSRPEENVICLDGDGALLMRMGSLATNAAYKPENMLHIVLDNAVHDSTGAQPTVSRSMNLPLVALSCGYPEAVSISDPAKVAEFISNWKKTGGLVFLHVPITVGSRPEVGRPTVTPAQVAQRFRAALS